MLNRNILLRLAAVLIAALFGLRLTIEPAAAAQFDFGALEPSTLFVQAAAGDQRTQSYVGGATWDWNWDKQYSFMTATGYFEAAGGRWSTRDSGVTSSTWATQVGVTPVIRLHPAARFSSWFAELGVGANYIVPLYRTDHKRFSTEFNFGVTLRSGVNLVNAGSTSWPCVRSTFPMRASNTPTPARTSYNCAMHINCGDIPSEREALGMAQ